MGDNGIAWIVVLSILFSAMMGTVGGLLVLIGAGWVIYRLWYYFSAKDIEQPVAYECPYHPNYYITASPLTGETLSDCQACLEDRDAGEGHQAGKGETSAPESRGGSMGERTSQPGLFMGD